MKFIADLKRWLKKQFGKDFVYQGDILEHGDQQDGSSCSIVCRSTIAANVFGEKTWEQKHAAGARATCFIRLVRSAAIREMVSERLIRMSCLLIMGVGATSTEKTSA